MNFLSKLSVGGTTHLGIDIGASSVKVIGAKVSKKSVKIIGIGMAETPTGCVTDGVINDPRTLVESVKTALLNANIPNFRGMKANVGMSGVGVMFRRLTLPMTSPEEMEEQIILEAQQQIESDLSDWIIAHQILTTPDRHGHIAAMLVGAKKHVAEEYVNLLRLTGLVPGVFDCDVFAIANTYENMCGGHISETALCLDIGRDTTKFHLIQDNIPIIVRSFQSGGVHLTDLLTKKLGLDFDQAELLKINSSINNETSVENDCENTFSEYIKELTTEIKQTIEFFANSNTDTQIDKIDKIILSGGGATTRGLAEAISGTFKSQIEFANPFKRVELTPKAEESLAELPAHIFSVAFGLAMRKTGDNES